MHLQEALYKYHVYMVAFLKQTLYTKYYKKSATYTLRSLHQGVI